MERAIGYKVAGPSGAPSSDAPDTTEHCKIVVRHLYHTDADSRVGRRNTGMQVGI